MNAADVEGRPPGPAHAPDPLRGGEPAPAAVREAAEERAVGSEDDAHGRADALAEEEARALVLTAHLLEHRARDEAVRELGDEPLASKRPEAAAAAVLDEVPGRAHPLVRQPHGRWLARAIGRRGVARLCGAQRQRPAGRAGVGRRNRGRVGALRRAWCVRV